MALSPFFEVIIAKSQNHPSISFDVNRARGILKGDDNEYSLLTKEYLGQEKGVNRFRAFVQEKSTGKTFFAYYFEGYKESIGYYVYPFDFTEPIFFDAEWNPKETVKQP